MVVFNGNTEIINNSYEDSDFSDQRFTDRTLCIDPTIEDNYRDTLSDDVDIVYHEKELEERMDALYKESAWYNKYGADTKKKIERADMCDIFYYFKGKLVADSRFNIVEIFCIICEFFDFNYKLMYNDIISLSDKSSILELLERNYGLEKEFSHTLKLF